MTPADLAALDARLDRAIDTLGADLEADLIAVMRQLRRRILQLVDLLQTQQGRVQSTVVNLRIAQQAEAQLIQALQQAGYQRVVTSALNRLPELATFALAPLAKTGAGTLTAIDVNTLTAFRSLKLAEFLKVGQDVARTIRSTLLKAVMGTQDKAELILELSEVLDLTVPQARTLYETALSEFVRTITAVKSSGESEELFLYSGPIDLRLRPFCLERVGKVFTRAEIDAMDNGQLPNTFLTMGGWNCRHVPRPVSVLSGLADVAGTGQHANQRYADEVARVIAQRKAGVKVPKKAA